MKQKTMTVVMLEAGKEAYVKEINTGLENLQNIVGGLIEAVYPFAEEVCIICNEEGKLQSLPLNRSLKDENGNIVEIIAGTAFVCSCAGENFDSLTKEQQERYCDIFRYPELFIKLGGRIMSIPVLD